MSKLNRETLLRQGEQQLLDWGIGADANVAALSAVSGRGAATDLALATRLGAIADASSITALQSLERTAADKLVHKEVKRALYRLQQRGLAVPQPAATALPLVIAAPALEGYMSAFDGRGDQLVWLVKPHLGGVDHLFAVINDPEGLREVTLAETTRKLLRAATQDMRDKHDIHMVSADWEYCDFVIARAFAWANQRQQTVSGDYKGLRSHLCSEPAAADLPPLIFALLDPESIRHDAETLAASAGLLDEKELRTWFFTAEDLKPYLDELQQAKETPLVLSELQQRDRFAEVIGRAVEELFGGDRQTSWVRRLEEMAYYFHATNRRERARQSLAAALALEASPRGGHDVPLCEVLTRTCVAAYWQMAKREEAEESQGSLVLTPAQIAREAQQRRQR